MNPRVAVVGLSHHTAPIEVRERMALETEQIEALLKRLVAQPEVSEALVLSTCNRVEIVACAHSDADLERVDETVVAQLAAVAANLTPYLYRHLGERGLTHLFRVASSLDSLVVGEPQILGQLKQALEFAQEVGTVGPSLRRLTTHAVRAAKRVRTETALGVGQVSVPSVAVDLTRRIYGDLRGRKAVLLGLGEMGQLVAKQLGGEGAELLALGRNRQKVERVASEIGAAPRSLDQLAATLLEADVLVAMTSAHDYVVKYDDVKPLMRQRRGRRLFFVDLSVPRNIDPRVDELDDVFLYNIDDLSQIVHRSKSSRRGEAERAEAIVQQETQNFARAASAEQVTPTVVGLRRMLKQALSAEHDKSQRGKLRHLSERDHASIEKMLDAAINKLLHTPTMKLRELATSPADAQQLDQLMNSLTELFELDAPPEAVKRDRRDSLKPQADRQPRPEPTSVTPPEPGGSPSVRAGEPG